MRGRNTYHCSLVTKWDLVNRFILNSVNILIFFYFGFFLKIYLLNNLVSFTAITPISFAPALIIYWKELLGSYSQHQANYKSKKEHLK
jgi:mannose/fructose/N-acetylgalactosamine-specific phosphotransferase system component IIC